MKTTIRQREALQFRLEALISYILMLIDLKNSITQRYEELLNEIPEKFDSINDMVLYAEENTMGDINDPFNCDLLKNKTVNDQRIIRTKNQIENIIPIKNRFVKINLGGKDYGIIYRLDKIGIIDWNVIDHYITNNKSTKDLLQNGSTNIWI